MNAKHIAIRLLFHLKALKVIRGADIEKLTCYDFNDIKYLFRGHYHHNPYASSNYRDEKSHASNFFEIATRYPEGKGDRITYITVFCFHENNEFGVDWSARGESCAEITKIKMRRREIISSGTNLPFTETLVNRHDNNLYQRYVQKDGEYRVVPKFLW